IDQRKRNQNGFVVEWRSVTWVSASSHRRRASSLLPKDENTSNKFEMEVIRDVDLNSWDLQERCKIGSTPQNEWYFFSQKDRKHPTGSRTNQEELIMAKRLIGSCMNTVLKMLMILDAILVKMDWVACEDVFSEVIIDVIADLDDVLNGENHMDARTNGISSAKRIENIRPGQGQTVRATHEGFWKATGRDKCIRNSYQKIGMRKTLVFYKGRVHHGQKTDWIMHEYRLEDADDPQRNPSMDWVACEDVFSEVIIDVIADVDDVLNGENHMDARC
ncbi:hypothetical protein F2Q70_00017272, partial [Brassica cretica]